MTPARCLVACLLVLSMAACSPAASGTVPASPAPPSAQPSVTPSPVPPTPTRTTTPLPTPTLAGTLEPFPLPPGVVWDSTYFNDPSICELPCWNGLVVGTSTIDDARQVMRQVFGLSEVQAAYASKSGPAEIPELYFVEYEWVLPPTRQGVTDFGSAVHIVFWTENATDLVKRIGMRWLTGNDPYTKGSLANILLAQTAPPEVITLLLKTTVQPPDSVAAQVKVIYADGHGTSYSTILTVTERHVETGPVKADFCLDSLFDGSVWIMEPFLDDVGNFDPIQEYLIGGILENPPFEEATGYTPEALYELAITQPDACIPVTIP